MTKNSENRFISNVKESIDHLRHARNCAGNADHAFLAHLIEMALLEARQILVTAPQDEAR